MEKAMKKIMQFCPYRFIILLAVVLMSQGAWAYPITVNDGETKTITSDTNLYGGDLTVWSGGKLVIANGVTVTCGTFALRGGTLENNGTLKCSEFNDVGGNGTVTNNGTITCDCMGIGSGTVVTNNGTIESPGISNNGTIYNNGGTITYTTLTGNPISEPHTHEWGEWVTTEQPTTSSYGTSTRTCVGNSEHKETRIIFKLRDTSKTHTPYNGTPSTPQKISSSNYADYGFTANNYKHYEEYYGIRNAAELYGYAALDNNQHGKAVLTDDIVVNTEGSTTYPWVNFQLHSGEIFDGTGHTISGLYNNVTGDYAGLFKEVDGIVRNLGILNSTFIASGSYTGSVAGSSIGTIVNCYAVDVTVKASQHVGGIAGRTTTEEVVQNCFAIATVSGNGNVYPVSIYYTNSYGASSITALNGVSTGKLCNDLNSGVTDGSQAWYQKLPSTSSGQTTAGDPYPTLISDGSNTVFGGYSNGCIPLFSNRKEDIAGTVQNHSFENGTIARGQDGLYYYACDHGCGTADSNHEKDRVVMDFTVNSGDEKSWHHYHIFVRGELTIKGGGVVNVNDVTVESTGKIINYSMLAPVASEISETPTMTNNGAVYNFGLGVIPNYKKWEGNEAINGNSLTHTWSGWNVIENPSTTQYGTLQRTCTGNGTHVAHIENKILFKLRDPNKIPTPYNGTPTTPKPITVENYKDYGFTVNNWYFYRYYYAITNASELYGLPIKCNVVLTEDIVVNTTTLDEYNEYTWNGYDLGSNTFDGTGHTISGLREYKTTGNAGLITFLDNAVVKNLGILNSSFIANGGAAGTISGVGYKDSRVSDCYVVNIGLYSMSNKNSYYIVPGYQNNCFAVNVNNATLFSPYPDYAVNCYGAESVDKLKGASTGELCYKLNNNVEDGSQLWHQKLPTTNSGQTTAGDPYPTLMADVNSTVYRGYGCTESQTIYSNSNTGFNKTPIGHKYDNKILTTDADANGLYSYVCENGCGEASASMKIAKDFKPGQNLELTVDNNGNYSTGNEFTLTDAVGAFCIPVVFSSTNATAPSYSRSVVAGNMGSFCMPFATDVTGKFEKVYIPAKVALITGNDLCILFRETTGTVAAKTPFIAKIKETGTVVLTSTTGSLDFINPQPQGIKLFNYSDSGGALLQNNDYDVSFGGSTVGKGWMEGLYSMGAQGEFMKMESKGINPYRAFVTKTAKASGAKAYNIYGVFGDDDDNVTGIMNLTTGKVAPVAPTGIYTLDGKRVNSADNLPKGTIYIINGKKVVKQ